MLPLLTCTTGDEIAAASVAASFPVDVTHGRLGAKIGVGFRPSRAWTGVLVSWLLLPGTKLPATKGQTLTTVRDDQEHIFFDLFTLAAGAADDQKQFVGWCTAHVVAAPKGARQVTHGRALFVCVLVSAPLALSPSHHSVSSVASALPAILSGASLLVPRHTRRDLTHFHTHRILYHAREKNLLSVLV